MAGPFVTSISPIITTSTILLQQQQRRLLLVVLLLLLMMAVTPTLLLRECSPPPDPLPTGNTYLPYKAGNKDYPNDLITCFKQLDNVTEIRDFNITADVCTEYQPYCNNQSAEGCCAFHDEYYRNDHEETCWTLIHSAYVNREISDCITRRCESLMSGENVYCDLDTICDTSCNSYRYCDPDSCCVRKCRDVCHDERAVRFYWIWSNGGEPADGFLQTCHKRTYANGKRVFGCPSSVVVVNDSFISSCHLQLEDAPVYVKEYRWADVYNETYHWTVFNHGKELDSNRSNFSTTQWGDLRMSLSNLTLEDSNSEGLKCYVERLGDRESDVSTLSKEKQKTKGGDTPYVEAIGFEEAPTPIVVDPLRNFQTEAVRKVDFGSHSSNEDKYYVTYTCNISYYRHPKYDHLVRFLWFGMMFYNGWSQSFNSYEKQFGAGRPMPKRFPKAELLDSNYTTLWDVRFYGDAPGKPEMMTVQLRSDVKSIDRKRGSLAVCALYTEVGLFSKEYITPPDVDFNLHIDEVNIQLTVLIAGIMALFFSLTSIILSLKHKHTVTVSVFKNLQTAASTHVNWTSTSCFEEEEEEETDVDGYLPMRNLTAVRDTVPTSPPLETVPETDVIGPLSPHRVRFQMDTVSVYESTSPPSTPSSVPTRRFNSAPVPAPRRLNSARSMSDSSTTSSDRPGISVQPTEDSFDVRFSKLKGDADKVLLSSRKFNVDVPVELQFLRVHHKRIQFHEVLGQGNFGVVYRGELSSQGMRKEVAVKVLKEDATFEALKDLVLEATFMAVVGKHENINSIEAVCFSNRPCLATEFCKFGDLKHVLTEEMTRIPTAQMADVCPIFYCWTAEVAAGVQFLHHKKIVHRDLACRNILVDGNLCCKVADFGLARDISNTEYYRINSKKCLPFRWLSPEIFTDSTFTFASDVWAFAVTVWEIFNHGDAPYADKGTLEQARQFVLDGGRLTLPSDTDPGLQTLLAECFSECIASRPTMSLMLPVLQSLKSSNYEPRNKDVALQHMAN